ncbi:MAG: hypothetical protein ACLFO2_03840 [Candidatus Woesearchaeota archaeon]
MRIDFFEEYPTVENLEKLELVTFPTTVYVAARSLEEFEALRERVATINPKAEAAYWPVLEGTYWVSPFSKPSELGRVEEELSLADGKVLLDLELPFPKNTSFSGLCSFFRNKKRIERLFEGAAKRGVDVRTAEYAPWSERRRRWLERLGVSYPLDKHPHTKIVMYYTSMSGDKQTLQRIRRRLKTLSKEAGRRLQLGLGTIATGVMGDEPKLSPEGLDRDLSFCQELGVSTAVVFRLGGLDKRYLEVIEKHARHP